MKYTDVWNDLTKKMGYWVDTNNPYVTYDNKYIESVWWLLNQAYDKNYIYKGYTIQPYSPKAGTGLSSHELNQPGCYKQVKDTSITAQFLLKPENKTVFNVKGPVFFIAWTTTPWTLPSNTALAVNEKVEYVLVKTTNQYTQKSCHIILAKQRLSHVLSSPYVEKNAFVDKSKQIPYEIIQDINGENLIGCLMNNSSLLQSLIKVLKTLLKLFMVTLYRRMTEQVLFTLHLRLVQMMQKQLKKLVCLQCSS